jgi:hypothetical protein
MICISITAAAFEAIKAVAGRHSRARRAEIRVL